MTTEQEQIRQQIQVVAEARRRQDEAMSNLKEGLNQWEATEGLGLRGRVRMAFEVCTQASDILRDMTLAAYHKTGSKHPAPGVEVRLVQQLDYDPALALIWAMDKRLALRLDPKAFEKLAKAMPLDFVTITEVPQATIAGDLDAVLKDMEEK